MQKKKTGKKNTKKCLPFLACLIDYLFTHWYDNNMHIRNTRLNNFLEISFLWKKFFTREQLELEVQRKGTCMQSKWSCFWKTFISPLKIICLNITTCFSSYGFFCFHSIESKGVLFLNSSQLTYGFWRVFDKLQFR